MSQIRPPRDNPPPPNSSDENHCAGIIIAHISPPIQIPVVASLYGCSINIYKKHDIKCTKYRTEQFKFHS